MPGGLGTPVLITHGTFSTADTCRPIAEYFAAKGRPVYVIEWRGRNGRPGRFDFHDLAEGEFAQAIQMMPKRVDLVAHSGGGLAMCFAVLDPDLRAKVRSLTMLGTQGTHLFDAPWRDLQAIRLMDWYGRKRGFWPARLTGLGPCNESATLLSQWVRFNRNRKIMTRGGTNLFDYLPALGLPVFALAGAADTVIARPEGCERLAKAFGVRSEYHLCRAGTDTEDFTHPRLFRSRAAAARIWPRIIAFHARL